MKAFTLVELIIVLVVVGILAVSATPLFVGTGGVESLSLREQAVTVLRNIQLSAMQDTTSGCRVAVIKPTTLGRPNEACGSDDPNDYSLATTDAEANDRILDFGANTVAFNDADGASVPVAIKFGPLGRPDNVNCTTVCRIDFTEPKGAVASLCINQEGYISAC